jgi:hypothetical protein
MHVHISDATELLQEISGKEGEVGVLRCDNLVSDVYMLLLWLAIGCQVIRWKALTDENSAGRPGLTASREERLDVEGSQPIVPCDETRTSWRH